jgi:hypothetical protein
MTSAIRMRTAPSRPTTMRTTSVRPSHAGMQSTMRTTPSAVAKSVSSTSVSGRYARRTFSTPAAGASCQWPCRRSPSSAAKHASESKRGTHIQSIEPSLPTSAADRVLPISA